MSNLPILAFKAVNSRSPQYRWARSPQRYLTSILARLPGLPPSNLSKLLPDAWKRADVNVTSS